MTHTRPSISLGCILKNEENNLERFLEQVTPLFDEIVMVDTGSTDKSLDILTDWARSHGHIKIDYFKWVNDFGKARQYCMDKCSKDYFMWLDLDDELTNVDEFIRFRDHTMHSADYWLVNYNYAQDPEGSPVCEFVRERVVKNDGKFYWNYPIHEGMVSKNDGRKVWPQRCLTWEVKHVRTEDDIKKDRSRNINLFESYKEDGNLDARMTFYYGKELFDVGRHKEASKYLMEACQDESTSFGDRIMALQYCAQSAYLSEAYEQAEQIALNGVQLLPQRAEFWCVLGDCSIKRGKFQNAKLYYECAKHCDQGAAKVNDMIFSMPSSYFEYPQFQITQCEIQMGEIDKAKAALKKLGYSKSYDQLVKQVEKLDKMSRIREDVTEVEEIVISTPPMATTKEWDEDVHKVKGLGGSETAAVEVAKFMRKKLGVPVKVFNMREEYKKCESGVEYVPLKELGTYFQRYKPKFHIAWRHAVKLSSAPMFTWCHDLQCGGAEKQDFDKILALSPFHKEYLHTTQGISLDKIELFRNGVDPELWNDEPVEKNPDKVIFSSSPDRGLERCIKICKKTREMGVPVELHLFYGFENMRKMGMSDEADRLEALIEGNKDFVTFHGNVGKKELIRHFRESAIWLYPADFIETYCITALEALASGCYPMIRRMGALPDTLASAADKKQYWITDKNAETDEEIEYWAENLKKAVLEKKWEGVTLDIAGHSWEKVTEDLIKLMANEGVKFGNTD